MAVTKKRIKTIVTLTCVDSGIETEFIEKGCEHAEVIYERTHLFATSVKSGIALAENLHKEFLKSKKKN